MARTDAPTIDGAPAPPPRAKIQWALFWQLAGEESKSSGGPLQSQPRGVPGDHSYGSLANAIWDNLEDKRGGSLRSSLDRAHASFKQYLRKYVSPGGQKGARRWAALTGATVDLLEFFYDAERKSFARARDAQIARKSNLDAVKAACDLETLTIRDLHTDAPEPIRDLRLALRHGW